MTNPNEVEELKSCPFCGCNPMIHLGKKTGCQLHGEPMQGIVIRCHWDRCPAKPRIETGDIFNGGEKLARKQAIELWNTRVSPPPSKEETHIMTECMDCKSQIELCKTYLHKCEVKQFSGYSTELPEKLEFNSPLTPLGEKMVYELANKLGNDMYARSYAKMVIELGYVLPSHSGVAIVPSKLELMSAIQKGLNNYDEGEQLGRDMAVYHISKAILQLLTKDTA